MSKRNKRPKKSQRSVKENTTRVRHGRLTLRRDSMSATVLVLLMIAWIVIRYEPVTSPAHADVIVYTSLPCSCYRPWIRELRSEGLAVSVVEAEDIAGTQATLGVPREFAACHTAMANGYWIEGHVPAETITILLEEEPEDVGGLAHLRVPVRSGDKLSWEVVTYDAEGRPKSIAKPSDSPATGEEIEAH